MKKLYYSMPAIFAALAVFFVVRWYYTGQINKKEVELRKSREETAQLNTQHSAALGEISTKLAVVSDNLKKEESLTKEQKDNLKRLQKELDIKVDEISYLRMEIDSLNFHGVADTITIEGVKTYTVVEKQNGATVDISLKHPTGQYELNIKQDPISMELYMSKDSNGDKVGAIRFPNQPWIHTTSWQVVYDPDTRTWYQKIWDDLGLELGAFAGSDTGFAGIVSYKRLNIGQVLTKEGNSMYMGYSIKR